MTEAEHEIIIVDVKQAAADLVSASLNADADRVLSFYRSDAIVIEQGVINPSIADVARAVRAFYENNQVLENALEEMRVKVLSSDAAVLTCYFQFASLDTTGQKQQVRGAWTAVFTHQDGEWKIVVAHQSSPNSSSV